MHQSRSRVLLIQAGTAPDGIRDVHGDLPVWFGRALGLTADAVEVVRLFEGEPLPPPDASRVAVITGSWAMVTERLPWSERAAAWVRDAMAIEMPLFGVCYGHQLMAHALGGLVDYHPSGREIGSQPVRLTTEGISDDLLAGVPSEFGAHLTHMQTVVALPPGARVLAANSHDPHQILRYRPQAVSVQFHPEFTPEISRAIIRLREAALRAEGRDPAAFLDAVDDAPEPLRLLRRFVSTALARRPDDAAPRRAAAA